MNWEYMFGTAEGDTDALRALARWDTEGWEVAGYIHRDWHVFLLKRRVPRAAVEMAVGGAGDSERQ